MGREHAQAYAWLSQTEDVEIAGVVGRDSAKVRMLGKEVGAPHFTDPARVLEDDAIDAIDIAYPSSLHRQFALAAPESLRRQVGSADGRIFLARDSDAIVGFAATRRMDDDSAELAGIIVLQGQLGCGIGSGLLAAAVDAAHRDGYRRIVVRTEVDNERALAFYKTKGFVAVRRMPDPSVPVEVWELVRGL